MEVQENITQAASTLFMQFGIKSVTMDEIASHLGISKKTIYQYFKDKDELVCQVTKRILEIDRDECEQIFDQSADAIEELFEISKFLRERVISVNPSLLFDLKKYHPKSWKVYLDYKENVFLDTIITSLNRGKEEGFFREDIDPEILATLRMEEIQMSFDDGIFPKSKFDFKRIQLQFFDHFVNGIITEKGRRHWNSYMEKANTKAA